MANSEVFTALEVDAVTGENVERVLSIDELTEYKMSADLAKLEQDAKAAARESALAKLADLGLTAEEIAAL